MTCDWQGTDILVLKAVLISKPYRPEDCVQVKDMDNNQVIERVKKVLAGEREKLQKKERERQKNQSSSSPTPSP